MNKSYLAVFVLALVVKPASAGPASQPIVCPPELPAESLRVATSPPGWKPFIASPLYLHDAAPISGPPERQGTIVARTVKTGKSSWIESYNLDYPFPEGKWFLCGYGVGNEFTIAKRMDDGIKSCVVKGRKGEKFGQNTFDIQCK